MSTVTLHVPGRLERTMGRVPTRVLVLLAASIYAGAFVIVWLLGVPRYMEASAFGVLDKVVAAQEQYADHHGEYADSFSDLVHDGGLAVFDDLDQRADIRMESTGDTYRVEIDPGTGTWWAVTDQDTTPQQR